MKETEGKDSVPDYREGFKLLDSLIENPKISLEDLNAALKSYTGGFEAESKEEAVEEIKRNILLTTHRQIGSWVLDRDACKYFGIRYSQSAVESILNSKMYTGNEEYLKKCSDKSLNIVARELNSWYGNVGLEFVDKETSIPIILSVLHNACTLVFFKVEKGTADSVRKFCTAFGISKSGNQYELSATIAQHLFPFSMKLGKKLNLRKDNEDPRDFILNGLALVTREDGIATSIQFTRRGWYLRYLIIRILEDTERASRIDSNWSGDRVENSEDEDEDEYDDDYDESEEEEDSSQPKVDENENPKLAILIPMHFSMDEVKMSYSAMKMIRDCKDKKETETWMEKKQRKHCEKLKEKYRMKEKKKLLAEELEIFCNWLQSEEDLLPVFNYKEHSTISFGELIKSMAPGSFVKYCPKIFGGRVIGLKVVSSWYSAKTTNMGLCTFRRWTFHTNLVTIHATGSSFVYSQDSFDIGEFEERIPKEYIQIQPLEDEAIPELKQRALKYIEYSKGHQFKAHKEESFRLGYGKVHVKGGRMMLDIDSARSDDEYSGYNHTGRIGSGAKKMLIKWSDRKKEAKESEGLFGKKNGELIYELKSVPDELLCICWPAIAAFSFEFKQWGFVMVDDIQEIKWNDRAFDQLVLNQERKELIQAIVTNTEKLSTDIIEGKGGGTIILLHGPPGTGKTLTAEAVAEMLHKPLYYVSVGELGTTPSELERKLTSVLDLSLIWKSVMLIDEADVFLEERGHHEIIRNAMVGVMIKKLEYYQGILFLTSNRVENFDNAFYSRITLALRYDELDEGTRESVWKMLFENWGIELDSKPFAKSVLNGRQIKNCIALAQGLAKVRERKITESDVTQTVSITRDFIESMEREKIQHNTEKNAVKT